MGKKLAKHKIAAIVQTIKEDNNLLNAAFIYIATLLSMYSFMAFHPYLIPFLALIPAFAGYFVPPLGSILSVLFLNISIFYQAPLLGWIFGIILSATMVVSFKEWYIVPILELIIFAPFIVGYNVGGLILPLIFFVSLKLGAKRSLTVSIPAVFMVLFLSALWDTPNTAYLPINDELYSSITGNIPSYLYMRSEEPLSILNAASAIAEALGRAFDPDVFNNLNNFFSSSGAIVLTLFFGDVGLLELILFSIIIYVSTLLPGIIRHKFAQTISSIAFWAYLPIYFLLSTLTGNYFDSSIVLYLSMTTFAIYYLDLSGIYIAGQTEYSLREKESKLSKFGIHDLGLASKISLSDIGNYDDVKKELREAILTPLLHKDISIAYGIKPPKGILLFGPPGTGKTLLMRALANELQVGFYYVKASNLLSHYFGESERNVSEVFRIARENSPSVLFFDEIDSVAMSREYLTNDESAARVLSTMLQEMDGLSSDSKVLVVGATNVPHLLDKALLRPGRLDKIIYMHLPDKEGRLKILQVHLKDVPLSDDVNLEVIAKKTERFSGADLKNLCNEAIRLAANEALSKSEIVPVRMEHFEKVLSSLKPSTSLEMLDEYEHFRLDFERRVGGDDEKKEDEKPVSWKDVIGLDRIREIMLDALQVPLLHPELLEKYDVKPAKGMLMFGPPGCGKTLIVKAAANELDVNLLTLSGADLLKKGYEGAISKIKEIFNRARENTPAIIFIDEIESLAPSRDLYNSKFVEDVVTELLRQMDGFKEMKGVFVIGATNKPNLLDKAIIRPGRLDKIVFVPPPVKEAREEMFKHFLSNVPTAGDIDWEELAELTEGFTGADISSICQSAKYLLVKRELKGEKSPKISMKDLLSIIEGRKPSITLDMLKAYEQFVDEYGQRL